ncbi:MAG TPA: GTPase, partial [Sphingomicrobium sp.]|nr:GTPase [Sphingomicrobium sp.]
GRIDLTEAEGLADLIEAETEAQRKAALRVAEGGIRRQAEDWRQRLIDLSAQAEAAIDYVGDEDETAIDEGALRAGAGALAAEIQAWLERPRAEVLKDGVRVVAAGPPNAGKSSLVNALGGIDRAIVTDVPGTTRDVIEVPLAFEGVPFVLVDTAGLHDSDDRVERIGIARAETELVRADILLWLGDPGAVPAHSGLVRVFPRTDESGRGPVPPGSVAVSSVTGEGLANLWHAIRSRAHDILPAEGEIAINRRQFDCLEAAAAALEPVAAETDIAIIAHHLTLARNALDRLTGAAGVEDMLDALFARFCLGK